MPKITISLNSRSIDSAIKQVAAYRKKVKDAATFLVHELTEQGVLIAQLRVVDMNALDSGELMNNIDSQYRGNVGIVVADSKHAAFVEFGTGIVGADNPHPEVAIAGWRYDTNEHGVLGWWYEGKDGKAKWTKGMPSRPYMYQTAQMLRQLVVPTAKEVMK